tara:strand:- start:398 stop:1501 length:1104 start_codon:yes stop_codon:yes gene_type:complete
MNKKKIVFFMPFIGGGGVEKNLFIIANFFSKKFENTIVCTYSKKYKKKFNKKINFLNPKINFIENINLRLKYLLCLFALFKFLRQNKNAIVFSFQANIYCILLCKILNVKIISRSNSSPSGWYHNYFKKIIYKKIISFAETVVVNSFEFKKEMEKNFKIKVNCIYNPLNTKEIIKKSKIRQKENFFSSKKNYLNIINIGRFTNQKDQITLLKAAEYLKDKIKFKLLILGRGKQQNNLKKYIKENNLSKHVKIKNFMNNPYPAIKKSDLFVLSSKYEGLPNVILEALTLKKFVISSNCPTGPKEILLNGRGGLLFKVGDHIDLSNKIIYYLKNKSKSKKMLANSINNLDRFDYASNLNKYYNLVKEKL